MITTMYAYSVMVGVIEEEPYRFNSAPLVIPWYEGDLREKVVVLHFLQEPRVIQASVLGSKKRVVYNETS